MPRISVWALARWLLGPVEFVQVGERDSYTFYLAYYQTEAARSHVRAVITEIKDGQTDTEKLVISNCYGGPVWTICRSESTEAGQVRVALGCPDPEWC